MEEEIREATTNVAIFLASNNNNNNNQRKQHALCLELQAEIKEKLNMRRTSSTAYEHVLVGSMF